MALICNKCTKEIKRRDFITYSNCQKDFHIDCTSLSEKRFYLMKPENRKKCKCDECLYKNRSSTKQIVMIPTDNSFEGLINESDEELNKYHEYVTLRSQKKPTSLPDLSASYTSMNDTNKSVYLNKTSLAYLDQIMEIICLL
jgi:hypothetical protein